MIEIKITAADAAEAVSEIARLAAALVRPQAAVEQTTTRIGLAGMSYTPGAPVLIADPEPAPPAEQTKPRRGRPPKAAAEFAPQAEQPADTEQQPAPAEVGGPRPSSDEDPAPAAAPAGEQPPPADIPPAPPEAGTPPAPTPTVNADDLRAQIRHALRDAVLTAAGRDAINKLVAKHGGAAGLSSVPVDNLPAMLADAKEMKA